MDSNLIEQVIQSAKDEEANLVVSDRRDTFTIEKDDLPSVEVSDGGYLKASMEDGKSTVYVMLDEVYKLVVEKEKARKSNIRTGFGAASE